MKLKLPKIFRRRKNPMRKHASQPAISTQDTAVLPPRSCSRSMEFIPAPRAKSYTTKNEVTLEQFILPPPAPVRLTLLPTTLVRENRQSFTSVTKRRITRGCQSFVRKMCHPRSLPDPPKTRITPATLNNGTFRRSLPELSSSSVLL